MKSFGIFLVGTIFSIVVYGQHDDQSRKDEKDPETKAETRKEYDEEDNLTQYDSAYSWHWSGEGVFNEEFLEEFEKRFNHFHENMEGFQDEFMSRFRFDDDWPDHFKELQKDFEFNFKDSAIYHDHFEKFFHDDQNNLHGFNLDGENFEIMPFDKEKMDEMQKRMKNLLNGEFDERIRKFIEEHKHEIDEIRYQIRESIPNRRKAI